MANSKNERIEYIDFVKGLGIFLIVWGHSMTVRSAYLYSFHLPLFFLISGFLYKKAPFISFFLNKVNRILIPFFFFFLLSWFFFLILILIGYDKYPLVNHIKLFPYLFAGIEKDGGNAAIWFLACLSSLTIMYSFLYHVIRNQYLFHSIIFLITLAGYLCIIWKIHLPYRTDIAFNAILFYHIGYLLRNIRFPNLFSMKWIKYSILILLVGLHYLCYRLNLKWSGIPNVNMLNNVLGNIYLFYITALLGIGYLLILSSEIKRISFFNYLGKNSLVIMSIHLLILYFLFNPLHHLFNQLSVLSGLSDFLTAVVTISICLPFILFFKKYLPKMTGYKSFIDFAMIRTEYGY